MTYQEWERLSSDEKLDYLFRHGIAAEQAAARLAATVQLRQERLAKIEAMRVESAG